ncbi:dihydrodipicolinate synthase family protein [Devosia sp.]|jgi:4-hydroxy-tetrahydrodipicolinate synthase|uniref:dihydrodipicolinate synthase family protein n=1 Tax=Devosia sp. TaxID=1871048 RepID=UPI0037C0EEB6
MSLPLLHGVVPILITPFDMEGRIDEESLERLVDFNVAAGVHGLGVALGSEIFKFNEAERAQVTARVIAAVRGRVPVVINSGAAGTDLAVHYSRAAEAAGANALMIIPPTFMPASADEIFDYYVAIDRQVGIPIILQDVPQGPVPPGLALRIADACKNVTYIKVETLPVTGKVAAMSAVAGDRLTIFGGAGGSYFIEEMRRGALGTMPFCSQPADFVAVWNAYHAGDEGLARTHFDRTIMAVNRLGNQGGDIFYAIHKQLLVRLGVIRTAFVRSPTTAIDPITQREIDELLSALVPEARAFGK